jgi:hypothetical protein
MFGQKENVKAGGLMSYSADTLDLVRRSAAYIDHILKGSSPADLPVEQASKYELAINLKTAKATRRRVSSNRARARRRGHRVTGMAPYPSERMTYWPVSTRVGNVKNNDPSI